MRYPAVAGSFYPSDEKSLHNSLVRMFEKAKDVEKFEKVFAAVSPHAGYMYSGQTAAYTFATIKKAYDSPPLFVILGPNHTGYGAEVSVSTEDWLTPLGKVKSDAEFASLMVDNSKYMELDEVAHAYEHSIEVQLPFIQFLYQDFRFVAVCVGRHELGVVEDIAGAIARAEEQSKKDIIVIASSDFTHYESAASANKKDFDAMENVKNLDYRGFVEKVLMKRYSICGFSPIAVSIAYSKTKGAKKSVLVKYTNSGDASGDYSSVVAYASIVFVNE
ncbi:MAG: MEMO1 family protein [Candidatus Micrarchaeia archaeon]